MANYSINLVLDGKSNIQAILATAGRDIDNFVSKINKMNTGGQGSTKGMDNQAMAIRRADAELAKYQKSIQSLTGPSINTNNFDAGMKKIQSTTKSTVSVVNKDLQGMGANVNFTNISNKFEASMRRVLSTAASTASGVGSYLNNIDSATAGITGIAGGYSANQIFDYGQGRATMQQMLSNMGKNDYYGPYQQFTQKSSTSDQDIVRMFQAIMTTPGLQGGQVYSALNAADAASYSADPVQRYRDMFAYSSFIQGGWDQAGRMLRDEGLSQAEQDKMQAADTPQERIDVLNEIAKTRGKVDEFGNSLSTTMSGPMANYNLVLAATDTIMRGMAQGMNDLLNVVGPIASKFLSLDTKTQNTIGKLVFFAGALVTGVAALKLLGAITPNFIKDKISGLLTGNKTAKMDVDAAVVNVNGKTTNTGGTTGRGGTATTTTSPTKKISAVEAGGLAVPVVYGAVNAYNAVDFGTDLYGRTGDIGRSAAGGISAFGKGLPMNLLTSTLLTGKFGGGSWVDQENQEYLNYGNIGKWAGGIPSWLSPLSGLNNQYNPLTSPLSGALSSLSTTKIPSLAGARDWLTGNAFKTPDWAKGGLFGTSSAAGSGGNKGILNDITGKNGLLDMSRFKLPNMGSIFKPLTTAGTGAIDEVYKDWDKLKSFVSSGVDGIVKIGSGSLNTAWNLGVKTYNYIRNGVNGIVDIGYSSIKQALDAFWNLYNTVRNNPIVQYVITKAQSGVGMVTNTLNEVGKLGADPVGYVKGAATNTVNWALHRGPGPIDIKSRLDSIFSRMRYSDYEGPSGRSVSQILSDGFANCVDGSLVAISMASGHLVPSTWNGNPHTYANLERVGNYDSANKMVTGNSNPHAKGPGSSKTSVVYTGPKELHIHLDGDVYGYNEFQKKVEKGMDEYIGKMGGIF